jgi:hypothetical protein
MGFENLKIFQKIKATALVLFFSGVVESASGVPPVTSPLHLWREKGLFWRESVAG